MISRSSVSCLAVLGAGLLLTLGSAGVASAAPVQDPVAVGPNQFFTGTVNGQAAPASIETDCVGPIVAGETGHPVPGQSVEALLANGSSTPTGFTGADANSLLITLSAPSSTASDVIGTTSNYFVPLAIPTTLTVPCGGTGTVTFTPESASSTARPYTLTVNFISLTLDPPA